MSLSFRRHLCTTVQPWLIRSFILGLLLLAMALCPIQGQAAGIALVQHTSKDAGVTTTSSLAFVSPNTAGNWIAVSIRGGLSSSQVFTVVDSSGNTYRQAAQIGFTSSAVTLAIYYAENIKGGANTITVSDTVSGPLRLAILEYSGVATSNSLDVFATATGTSATPNSGNLTTTTSGDLLLGAVATTNPGAFTAGTGYKIEEFVPAEPNTKLASEDQIQSSAGLASAAVSLSGSDVWGVVLVAFKPAGGIAGAPSTITATAGTPQSATVNAAFTIQLQATVKDSFNNPVNGASVTFTAPASGASGTFAGGVNTATTNASGVATSAVFTANGTAGGPYNVAASVSGVSTPANFSLTNLAGPAAKVTVTSGSGQSAAINAAFSAPLVATVTDSGNNPVSGVVVTFTAPASGASGTFAGGVNTATTNASGVATSAAFTANSTVGGPYNVVASATGATSATFSLTNLVGPPAKVVVTSGSGQSTAINSAFSAPLVATVTDVGNNPVSGVVVTFTAPASGATGTFAGGVNTATTNASGVATSAVFTANSTAGGPYNVVASATGATSANFSLTNLGAPPANIAVTSGSGQSAAINSPFSAPLVATVTDAGNNPVSGVVVTFTAPASGASGTFAGGVNTATTNASGVATSATFTANSTAGGPYNVAASVSGVSTPANFSLTNLVGPAAKVVVTSGSGQSTAINSAFSAPLVATVTDAGNNPVSNVVVTFTPPASGASGTFAGGTNTATTNSSGVATSGAFTANSTAGGPYNVVASAIGATSANFSLTNLAGSPASITATAGTSQSANVNAAFAVQLQATVNDSLNNPVSGVVVTFTAPASGASGTFAGGVNTATTNASGVATAPIFTANGTAGGPYTVTASVAGVATPANFSLTNLAGAPANIKLVQHISVDAGTTTSGSVAFVGANTAGNWIAVSIRGGLSNAQVFTVTDSNSNTYRKAAQIGFTSSAVSLAIYYAENIKGGADTVTVSQSVSGPLRIAILEYSGVATSNSLDVTAVATATSTSANSGNANTTANGDLLLGAIATTNPDTYTAGTGYTIEEFVPKSQNAKLVAEDQIQVSAGAASASASLATSDAWGVVFAAFKPANGGSGAGPTISSLNPTSGAVGASVTITGTNFGSSVGSSTVTFNGTPATTISSWSATSIIVPVPAGATTGPVVVTVGGVPSNGVSFTVIPTPNIASLNPTSGPIGTSVTIGGTNFGGSQTTSTVTFNGISAGTATSWSATSIVIPVPNGATTGNVVVTVSGASSNGVLFTVTSPGPSISSLSLTQGPVGANLTVNGANFGSTQLNNTVTFNGVPANASSWSASIINVTVPANATTGNVVVTVNGMLSNGVPFTVTPPPSITSISPTSGPIGTNVIITGTNFGPTVGTIQSFVTFNGTQTRASNWSDTRITAPVPAGTTTGNVLVFVGGVSSNGVLFTVTPPPSITSLSPNFGPTGTSVTIAGANFGASQGTSTVTFNGIAANPTSWSATSIVVPVPSVATSGNVVVTESGVPSNGVNFTVTMGTGNVALVQHTSLDAGTTTSASLAFASSNTAGNWIAVCIRAGTATSEVFTITDSLGNTYHQAFQVSLSSSPLVFAMYYAENIKGGANTVTVSDTISGPLRFAILEYSGVATSNSLDATPVTAQGSGTTASSGTFTTGANGDLLLAMVVTPNSDGFTAGSGYKIEDFVPAAPASKLITEDGIQPSAGTASATVTISPSDNWGAGLAAFRSINGIGFPISVSVSPSTVSVPAGYGTQAFTAALTNDFQSQGVTWALSGAGCAGSTCGTLTNVAATSVTYNAPASIPNPAMVTLTATAVGDNTKKSSATITIVQGALTVVLSPKRAAMPMSASQTLQFTATVYNDPSNSGVTWQVDGNNGGNSTTGTVSNAGLFTPGTQHGVHTVTVFSNTNASVSASSTLAVTDLAGVYTHHNDTARTGQNVQEYALTPATVTPATFGPLFSCPVDGFVYAEPLWVANLTLGATSHNVVFVATQHDSIYAFDADSPSCIQLWHVSFLGTNVTTLTPSDLQGNTDITPEIGITSTPVIDPATNTIYVLPKTRETVGTVNGQTCTTSSPCYPNRLHALDLLTGAEKFSGPVVISAPNFIQLQQLQRPALLLANNTLYIAFGSHGDHIPYQGWVMAYNPATLAQIFATFLTNPNNTNRGGIWGGGAGPAVDGSGNIYVSTGNGTYDGVTNYGDSAVKLSPTGAIADWFTPFNQNIFNANDIDLGSAGITVLPDAVASAAHPHLAIATGKVAILYLLDISQPAAGQTKMGKFSTSTNNDVQEVVPVPPPNTTLLDGGSYGNIAFWMTGPATGNIYTTGQNFPLSQFSISNGVISTPQAAKSTNSFPPRGGIPTVSANGTTNGVVWILDLSAWATNGPAILDAYDATNVGTLLFSTPTSGTGALGPAVKWSVPTVANGKVYIGAQYVFNVYGLLPN